LASFVVLGHPIRGKGSYKILDKKYDPQSQNRNNRVVDRSIEAD